ncbi:MAG: hypothetical protein RJQ09_02350 [Cyclobacteriaceae bacterium]
MKSLTQFLFAHINWKMGMLGAVIMGGIVVFINKNFGLNLALTAGLKQFIYTFFFGAIITRLCQNLATNGNMLKAVLIPSVITIGCVFIVHNFKGTPLPFESTLPTVLMAPPGFFGIAFRERSRKKQSR